jgi:hypothetical protein
MHINYYDFILGFQPTPGHRIMRFSGLEKVTSNEFCTKVCTSLVWYSIDREDQENESGFLCKKHFFVEKTVGSLNGLPRYQLTFSS